MKQLQFYKYATWGLLVLNVLLIGFFFLTKPKHPGRGSNNPKEILNLDKEQNTFFLNSAKQHSHKMDSISIRQAELLKPYFLSLTKLNENENIELPFEEFQKLERTKIELTFQHFQEIKDQLRPAQKVHFDAFLDHVLDRIFGKSAKGLHPPK